MPIEDAVAKMGVKKIYIMLGENDIGLYGVQTTVESASKLIENIKQKSPAAQLYVQSVTPMIKEKQLKNLNNENIAKFNVELEKMSAASAYKYLDVASVLKDKDGNLPREYCSDPKGLGIHFTDAACKKWVDYL